MYEKLSDQPKRNKKIKKLINKITKEIDKNLNDIKIFIIDSEWDDHFYQLIEKGFILIKLKEFITQNRFNDFTMSDAETDKIVYIIPINIIDIWLSPDYNFVNHFINAIFDFDKLHLGDCLTTHFLSSNIITPYEWGLYNNKESQ